MQTNIYGRMIEKLALPLGTMSVYLRCLRQYIAKDGLSNIHY